MTYEQWLDALAQTAAAHELSYDAATVRRLSPAIRALAEAELEYEDREDLSVYVDFEAEDREAVERAVAGEFVAESVRAKARLLGTRGRNGPLELRSAPQAARIAQADRLVFGEADFTRTDVDSHGALLYSLCGKA